MSGNSRFLFKSLFVHSFQYFSDTSVTFYAWSSKDTFYVILVSSNIFYVLHLQGSIAYMMATSSSSFFFCFPSQNCGGSPCW